MILAHGLGSRGDLPLPLWMFTWAAAIALVLSFVALGVLWTRPLLNHAAAGRSVARVGVVPLRQLHQVGRAMALTLFMLCLGAGLFGKDEISDNLLPVTVFVVVWVGAQLVGGTTGDLWAAVNPLTTLARGVEAGMTRLGRPPTLAPAGLGQWPAAAGLSVFLFYELAHPSGAEPRTLGRALAVHTLVTLALAARYGAEWVAGHEPFSALFSFLGAMGPLFRRDDVLALRPPLAGLARLRVEPGTAAALLAVLGGTSFDGFSESPLGRDLLGSATGWGQAMIEGLALTLSVVFISLLYLSGVWWTSRITGLTLGRAWDAFAPSLVPIVFGYAIAHYAQLLVDETQSFVFRLSDPFGAGWDLFGGADGQIDYTLLSPTLVAWVQVAAILSGHVGAVLVAHDRSVELLPAGQSLRSQFAMLLVMVAYSTLGLWLLLNA